MPALNHSRVMSAAGELSARSWTSLVSPGDTSEGASSFGAIASYQICACCAGFHGPSSSINGGGDLSTLLGADDRGTFGPNGKRSLSSSEAGAQITRDNLSWAGAPGTAATVTYAFRDSITAMPEDTSGFSRFGAMQINAALLAFGAWSDVANITFQRVQNAGSEFSNNATILLGNYNSGLPGAAAFAYLPGSTSHAASDGDVWVNNSLNYNIIPAQQGFGQLTLVHEIGHAIGLGHPADYDAGDGGSITYADNAVYFEDSRQYTVRTAITIRITGYAARSLSRPAHERNRSARIARRTPIAYSISISPLARPCPGPPHGEVSNARVEAWHLQAAREASSGDFSGRDQLDQHHPR